MVSPNSKRLLLAFENFDKDYQIEIISLGFVNKQYDYILGIFLMKITFEFHN
jgi:hypothetical protein